jgi:hypothetical protein
MLFARRNLDGLARAVGLYQAAAGAIATFNTLHFIPSHVRSLPHGVRWRAGALHGLLVAIYLCLWYSGIATFRRSRTGALALSILQCLQVPIIAFAGVSYFFHAGLYGGFIYDDFILFPYRGVAVTIDVDWAQKATFFGLNVVPIAWVLVLRSAFSREKDAVSTKAEE